MFRPWLRENPFILLFFLVLLASLLLLSHANHLLFHTVALFFSVLVGLTVFIMAWNARWRTGDHFLIVLGTGFLCVACLDFLHALTAPGITVFAAASKGQSVQLWAMARLAEAGAFLAAPTFLSKRLKPWILLINATTVTGLLASCIFLGLFPPLIAQDGSLTGFALFLQSVTTIMLGMGLILTKRASSMDKPVRTLVQLAIVMTLVQQWVFALCMGAVGPLPVAGYFLKLVAGFFIYKAVLETGLREPQRVLFMELERGRRLLADAERRYRSISDGSPVGIFRSTLDGRFEYANPALAAMYGYDSPADLITSVRNIGTELHLDHARWATMRKRMETEPVITGFTAQIRRKDGSTIWTSRDIRAHRSETGELIRFDGFVTDINDRVELECLRGDVDRILRHDLKAPLISITSGLAVVRATCSPDPRGEVMIREMERSAMQMLSLIDISAGLYKMEIGSYELEPESTDLILLCGQILSEQRTLSESRQLAMDIRLDNGEPAKGCSFQVEGEPPLVHVLLTNLIKNAMEAAPEGSALVLDFSTAEKTLTIRNGGEVPEDIRNRFFEKYTTSGKADGTGLGTYSAKLIAETHGWTMDMHTGNGSTSISILFSVQAPRTARTASQG